MYIAPDHHKVFSAKPLSAVPIKSMCGHAVMHTLLKMVATMEGLVPPRVGVAWMYDNINELPLGFRVTGSWQVGGRGRGW